MINFFRSNLFLNRNQDLVYLNTFIFARPDSLINKRCAYEYRKKVGIELAKETDVKADLVVPVPDSGVPAALGYAEQSNKHFELGLIRNHYVGRTFIEPTQSIRSLGVKLKLKCSTKQL